MIEAADWIVWQLCGRETRNVGTAGYKGIHQDGRYPSGDYLATLNPDFADFVDKLDHPLSALGERAGGLTAEAAAWTGLPEGTAVAVANVDAHVTAPAASATGAGQLVAHHGHLDLPRDERRRRWPRCPACAAWSDGGITAGLWGYEAGQSGVGDIFAWYVEHGVPESYRLRAGDRGVHALLTELAAEQPVGAHGLVALDWWNGNRSLLVDHELSGLHRRPDPGHPAAGHLPGAARVDRLRHPHDRRGVRDGRGAGQRARRRRRVWSATRCSCRSTPT